MKAELTFILPTLNRRAYVKRAIDSCLACEGPFIRPSVLVIDGGSNDGTFDFLKEIYSSESRVELLQNATDDFMHTCFQGVNLVKTEFATFMYDDDVLSPYFKDMISFMLNNNISFIMGYGKVYNVDKIYPFEPINVYRKYNKVDLLLGYFGRFDYLDYFNLPLSPICCMVTTDILRAWTTHVINFTQGNKLREYFLMKRNIGPDLLIYLSAILRERANITVASAIVAQFSAHPSSFTMTYANLDLRIGYWLAKIWAFQQLCRTGYHREAATCAAYLLSYGFMLIAKKIKRLELYWVKSICLELAGICYGLLNKHLVVSALKALFPIISNHFKFSKQVLPR